jgi:hypothetical protein
MANLINTIRSMNVIKEAPEDKMPASPDEGKMAYAQCEFIEYASEEICDYIENGGNFPEWFQNKLTKAHEVMKDLHSYMEGEKRASGTGQDPEEMDEAMDPVNKKALKKDFDDRKDKDIDNDGDTDDSDEYLHNRRKAVSKAIKGEGKGEKVEVNPKLDEETLEEEDHISKMEYHERQAQKTTGAEQKKHMEKAKEHRRKAEFAMRGGSAHSYKEELQIDEALETRISGGKVPVGQHTLHYKTDKSHKYISNSIKERDPKAKITGKDGHTIVHATAQAHSSVIKSLRDFRTSGVVHDDKASNMKEETMDEGTMSRYELIKKAAQKVNKGEKKAMSDAQKAAKKDKDLRKPKVDSADVDEANNPHAGMMDKMLSKVGKTRKDAEKSPDTSGKIHKSFKGGGRGGVQYNREEVDSADVDEGANILDKVGAAIHKAVVGDKQEKPAVVTAPAKKPAPKSKMKPLMPAQHESVENASEEVITEGNAAMELKKYANSKGGIDKQDFIAIANMIAKKKSAKDLAMVLQVQDTDPRDKALEIISKNDNKLYHEILKAARGMKPAKSIKKPDPKKLMAQYEEVELEEDYKQDAKNAPFDADPEKKKKQKNSDGTETKPMSKAKQLAKKGLVSEAEMTPAQKRKKEEIVKSMKDKKDYFERKYGDRAKDVMYATATKQAMKEGFEFTRDMFEAKILPSDGGPDGGGTPPVYTTKNGTNYKNGKPIGPVMDTDGASATTAPKKEEKSCKKESTTYSTTATTKDGKTYSKTATTNAPVVGKKLSAKDYPSSDKGLPTKDSKAKFRPTEEGTVTSVKDAQGGKVGLSNPNQTTYSKPFPDATPGEGKKLQINPTVKKIYDYITGQGKK